MANKISFQSSPQWQNWSGNLVHNAPKDGTNYYFAPTNENELKTAIALAKANQATIRASGQRHSQPPLVVADNRDHTPPTTNEYLVDLSCYADLGPNKDQRIILGPGPNQVTINAGVKEDELDAFLLAHNLMMKTVTAGGFFSIGGMVAVDVHGASIDSSIFAEDVSEFRLMLADETIATINEHSPDFEGFSALQLTRVSLGALGIITSIVLNVMARPRANTLQGGTQRLDLFSKKDFHTQFKTLLTKHSRLETFFTPYAAPWGLSNFLVLWWDVDTQPAPNEPIITPLFETSCTLASKTPPEYGAPYLSGFAQFGAAIAEQSQYTDWAFSPLAGPAVITAVARDTIEKDGKAGNQAHSDLWLNGAVAVIFMSYFIPLPNLEEDGMDKVWDSLDTVTKKVLPNGNFHIAAPMEFRFVKGGTSAMSGAFTDTQDTWFVNQDLIAFVKPNLKGSEYPAELLTFFADVERDWVAMGGFPHNGKMYGFYDPTDSHSRYSATGPFNPKFLYDLRKRRGQRLVSFNNYRKSLDPNGLFYNQYLKALLEDIPT